MKINGNLVFNSDASGELQNVYVERVAGGAEATTLPARGADSSTKGRLVFNTDNSKFYYDDGTVWLSIATGDNTQALQIEVDALETSLGSMVQSDGTFNAAAFNAFANVTAPSSVFNALSQIDAAIESIDTLDEILPATAAGQVIYADSNSDWQVAAPGSTSGVQAWDAGLDSISGLATSADQMIYATGSDTYATTSLTSYGRTLIDDVDAATARTTLGVVIGTDVQAWDAGLDALAAAGTGLVAMNGNNAYFRTMQAPAAGFTISDADGVAGNPTFTLANDLAALEGLATTGMVVRTGDGTATTRAIEGTAARIVVSNGDGVASAPAIDLAEVTQADSGTFVKVTLDSYGRVSGNTAVVQSDITGLVDSVYVNVDGDTMTGNLVMDGGTVTGLPTPVNGSDAAPKSYVDALTTGLSWKNSVAVVAASNITLSGEQTIDGVSVVAGMRVLAKGQTTDTENGIYVAAAGAWTRANDADAFAELTSAAIFVEQGTVYADTAWVQTTELAGFGSQSWIQFAGAGTYTAGIGLDLTGNVFSVNLGAGITELASDAVGIDLHSTTAGALILTLDGSSRDASDASKLHLLLKAAGGLTQDADGLYVPAAGITNAMLANSSVSTAADSGSGSLSLGGTLTVSGASAQGIDTSVADGTFTVTARDASDTQKGVASFDSGDFTVTDGNVVIAVGGVDNEQIAYPYMEFYADSGDETDVYQGNYDYATSDLGTWLDIFGDGIISTKMTVYGAGVDPETGDEIAPPDQDGSTLTISVQRAYQVDGVPQVGVAAFSTNDFTVTDLSQDGGVEATVEIVRKTLEDTVTDFNSTGADGNIIIKMNGAFETAKLYHLETVSSASTTWVVDHNMSQKYCNVTVVDSTDEVIIPQSIVFNTANRLTVTFTSAITGKVVVMGLNVPELLPA